MPFRNQQFGRLSVPLNRLTLLVAFLAMGALLRGFFLCEARRHPDFRHPGVDAQFHDYWARAILSGDWTPPGAESDPEIQRHPYFRPPGYPWFLALLYWVTDGSYFWSRARR
jgi:hypothetical protein